MYAKTFRKRKWELLISLKDRRLAHRVHYDDCACIIDEAVESLAKLERRSELATNADLENTENDVVRLASPDANGLAVRLDRLQKLYLSAQALQIETVPISKRLQ